MPGRDGESSDGLDQLRGILRQLPLYSAVAAAARSGSGNEPPSTQKDGQQRQARAAVLTLQGTLCPVTRSHVEALDEARMLLLGRESSRTQVAPRPRQLPYFDYVVAIIGLNDDEYVSAKFKRKTPPEPHICMSDRRRLVDIATREYDWIASSTDAWHEARKLLQEFDDRELLWFELDGADVALRSHTWNRARSDRRYGCVGRPSEAGHSNGTADVLDAMEEAGKGPNSDWYHEGNYLLLPEMPDISSSKAREALKANDMLSLQDMLHPQVLKWNLTEGPYKPSSGAAPESQQVSQPPAVAGRRATAARRASTAAHASVCRGRRRWPAVFASCLIPSICIGQRTLAVQRGTHLGRAQSCEWPSWSFGQTKHAKLQFSASQQRLRASRIASLVAPRIR